MSIICREKDHRKRVNTSMADCILNTIHTRAVITGGYIVSLWVFLLAYVKYVIHQI